MKKIPIHLYIIVFLVTFSIIASAFAVSFYINKNRTQSISEAINKLAIDIYSIETRVDLSKESECKSIASSGISKDLRELDSRISFMEDQLGENNTEIFRLRRYYGLLEIKNYLVGVKASKNCGVQIPSIIFISTKDSYCKDCHEQEFVIDAIQSNFEDLSVYRFNAYYDMPTISANTKFGTTTSNLPIIIIKEKAYYGFQSLEKITDLIYSTTSKNK